MEKNYLREIYIFMISCMLVIFTKCGLFGGNTTGILRAKQSLFLH